MIPPSFSSYVLRTLNCLVQKNFVSLLSMSLHYVHYLPILFHNSFYSSTFLFHTCDQVGKGYCSQNSLSGVLYNCTVSHKKHLKSHLIFHKSIIMSVFNFTESCYSVRLFYFQIIDNLICFRIMVKNIITSSSNSFMFQLNANPFLLL